MKEIKKVLLLGSGALKIGEAGEFDYSGTQAITALKEEGKVVILVNPNIATIQTSDGLADKVYFLPVTADFVERVIKIEKPDGILLSFGGQSALNCGIELFRRNVLKKYDVAILGTPIQAILDTEDRQLFAEKLKSLHLKTAIGTTITTLTEAISFAEKIGFPLMLRTGFALGGTGSGIIKNKSELKKRVSAALAIYPQLILEECLYGWKEIEYEVVRDSEDNCVTVCNMENFDPTGIHTGESIVIAPSQTLTNQEYFFLREISITAIRSLKIIGECNIQFAVNAKTGDYRIIEVNARLSRSSALASKATGYPLAYIATKLALGKKLHELSNSITKKTTAFFEPALDYVVVKIPRWDLEKYAHVDENIGSEMKSVGEIMSIAPTFEEAIQKGARMLNDGYVGVIDKNFDQDTPEVLREKLKKSTTMRLFTICSALRSGITVSEIAKLTKIDAWFLHKLAAIIAVYKKIEKTKSLTSALLLEAKQFGFSDRQIGDLMNKNESEIRKLRKKMGILPKVRRIDTLAGEFPAETNYMYMTYNAMSNDHVPKKEKKIIVVGSGPYSIGTSVEFDWCAVNTIGMVKKKGYRGIMINCNPETVSTDYNISDYLYFEELTLERFLDIVDIEQAPCILSVGGQIPNNISQKISDQNVNVFGPTTAQIKQAENREDFSNLLDSLSIVQPRWGRVKTYSLAKKFCEEIGYPVLLRPSFVLSGKAMRVIESAEELNDYMKKLDMNIKEHPLLITKYFKNAQECDFDGVADNGEIISYAISEHIENAGVHSGDSSLMLPAPTLSTKIQDQIYKASAKIIHSLHISGPFNIQYLVDQNKILVIECNLRASRSFPFVSKVLGVNFISLATEIMLGFRKTKLKQEQNNFYGVKVAQFSFNKLKGADPVPKIEMNSTGEVAAVGKDVKQAYLTAMMSTGVKYPTKKSVFVSLGGIYNKTKLLSSIKALSDSGYTLYATLGTAFYLKENGIAAQKVGKLHEGAEITAQELMQQKKIDFAVVIPESVSDHVPLSCVKKGLTDGYRIRRTAVDFGITVLTNVQSTTYFIEAILANASNDLPIQTIAELRASSL